MSRKSVMLVATATLVFGVDRFGKFKAMSQLEVGEREALLGNLLSLTHSQSKGAALGLFQDWTPGLQATVFGVLSIICAGLVLSFYRGLAPGEQGSAAALGAIVAGVASNALDRILHGVGIDFLHLGGVDAAHLPDFNLADLAILLGVLTLIVELLATEMAARAQERPRRSRSNDH